MDRLLENNTVLKVVSVLVAVALWLQATATSPQSITRHFGPIAVYPSASGNTNLTVMSIQPSTVVVYVKGNPTSVSSASIRQVAAWVKLSGLNKSGTYTLPVAASVPQGTSLIGVSPNQVVVTVDRMGSKKMPVTTRPIGNPNSAYEVKSLTPSSQSVTLSGPSHDLAKVKAVVADVPVKNRTASFTDQVILFPINSRGQTVPHVQVSPPTMSVNVSIAKKPPQKTVSVVAKLSGQPKSGYVVGNITVSPASMMITGSKSALSAVGQIDTIPINISGLSHSISEAVPLAFPSGVSSVDNLTDVTVTVTIRP